MSVRTLKRRFSELGLRKRGIGYDDLDLRTAVTREVEGPAGSLKGYRSIWHSLRRRYGMHVPRDKVARILHDLNPNGSRERQTRRLNRTRYFGYGPNFSWHVDGYDKLKPFGFPIDGAIDGYSRKVLWLRVTKSNNMPSVPCSFYMEQVKKVCGCPALIRSDCGTENVTLAAAQCYFRMEDSDQFCGENAHRYGTSPSNQRIEAWWSVLRRGSSSWWIDFFTSMKDNEIIVIGNTLHIECLWFCFHQILQNDLHVFRKHWNSHRIRKSKYCSVSGFPNVLYYSPHLSGKTDCKFVLPHEDKLASVEHSIAMEYDTNTYQNYFAYLLDSVPRDTATNVEQAFNLFQRLMDLAEA